MSRPAQAAQQPAQADLFGAAAPIAPALRLRPGEVPADAIPDGAVARLRFSPPYVDDDGERYETAEGRFARFLPDHRHFHFHGGPRRFGVGRTIALDGRCGVAATLLETAEDRAARIASALMGPLVFGAPAQDARGIEDQLSDLADMIAERADEHGLRSRREQLTRQFDAIADVVALAKRKRNYLLARARVGHDFHPWTCEDNRVLRIDTVRPIPADFETDPDERGDRAKRLREHVAIFGEAEREVRALASALRKAGHRPFRPHPNAQALLIRLRPIKRGRADFLVSATQNGLWHAEARTPDNKQNERALRAALRAGALDKLRADLEAATAAA